MQDPRTEFLNSVIMDGSRVSYSASPIVLLCGGKTPCKERPDDTDPPVSSLRHAITLERTSFEVFRPEEITDWHADGVYQNLMEYEADLAGICSLVVIILESPGAIAELGAFSQLEDLSHRLMVITSDSFSQDSFIELGILRHIRSKNNEGSVRVYPWTVPATEQHVFSIKDEIVKDLVKDVSDQLKQIPQNPTFKRNNNSHVIALTYQILQIFIALKLKELLEYLRILEIDIDENELKRKLFLLEQFRIIIKGKYSDSTYYAAKKDSFHQIRFNHKENTQIDLTRVKASCSAYYLASSDRHRLGFLKSKLHGVNGYA